VSAIEEPFERQRDGGIVGNLDGRLARCFWARAREVRAGYRDGPADGRPTQVRGLP
jgi:hypothetical protein